MIMQDLSLEDQEIFRSFIELVYLKYKNIRDIGDKHIFILSFGALCMQYGILDKEITNSSTSGHINVIKKIVGDIEGIISVIS